MKIDAYKTEQPQLVAEHPAFRNSCMHLAHLLLLLSLIVLVSVSGSNLHKRKDKGEEKKKDEDERDSRDIVVKSGTFKVRNTSVKEGETRLDDSSSGSNSQSSSQSGEGSGSRCCPFGTLTLSR